jgi:glycosyltransferase involved in cell wall biosynthesis
MTLNLMKRRRRRSLYDSGVVKNMPLAQRSHWLESFGRLYRDAVSAERNSIARTGAGKFQLLPAHTKIKLALFLHIFRVHRYKDRGNFAAPFDINGVIPAQVDEDAEGLTLTPWMIEDFKYFSQFEPLVWPTQEFVSQFHFYEPRLNVLPGQCYFDLYEAFGSEEIETVVIAPWLKRGGADKGILQFLEYYARKHKTLLITTLDHDSPWITSVPRNVRVMEFGKISRHLSDGDRIAVLSRLLIELKPRMIHNIQSDMAWQCIANHGKAFRHNASRIICSVFAEEMNPEGQRFGYAITYLPKVREYVDMVLTDSTVYRDTLRRRYSLRDERAHHVHFWQPLGEVPFEKVQRLKSVKASSVLWAGRICYQKRPDILFQVAQACPNLEFHVFGEPDETKWTLSWLKKIESLFNTRMYGAYNNFEAIIRAKKFDAFLYSTAYDGVPNVLLEAASYRLPLIAPSRIGGLPDLISPETAFNVDDADDPATYIYMLQACIANPAEAARRANNAFDLVGIRHSRDAFTNAMDRIIQDVCLPTVQTPE